MFKHLLVPLDGSRLAEAALPAAAYLARTLKAAVTLIHVIERHPPQEIHGERHLSDADEARAYLDGVRTRAFPADAHVDRHVHTAEVGDVARSLVDHAGELAPDLIVMCAHGRKGLRGFLFGSIAQQVASLDTTPVLFIRPREDGTPPPFTCGKILVPLDGSPVHEEGLHLALQLARECGAALHLVMVVPTVATLSGEKAGSGKLLPGATAEMLEMAEQGGGEYLGTCMAEMADSGVAVAAEVVRGDPAAAIAECGKRVETDLIIMGTHGKVGMNAQWSGSVAPKVCSLTMIPMLLVPVRSR